MVTGLGRGVNRHECTRGAQLDGVARGTWDRSALVPGGQRKVQASSMDSVAQGPILVEAMSR